MLCALRTHDVHTTTDLLATGVQVYQVARITLANNSKYDSGK